MSTIMNHQMITYFLQYDVPHAMIKILEEQRVNEEDLQTIDRDDIEHLFRNEYGFTFRHRKQFWNVLQNFQLANQKNTIECIEQQDETADIYEIIPDEPSNYHLTQHYTPLSSSNIPLPTEMYNHPYTNIPNNMFDENSLEKIGDHGITATTSLPVDNQLIEYSESNTSSDFVFQHPIELPIFSTKIMQAFENNDIESEWQTLVHELAQWITSRERFSLEKREYRAIGQTLYKQYPGIARDGFRPWSHLCKCLTQSMRKERKRRRLLSTHR